MPDETLTYPLPLRRRSIPERLRRAAQQITEIAVTIESTADDIEEHTP